MRHGDSRLPARFWAKVCVAPSGCWMWTAYTNAKGYGVLGVERTSQLAHRVAYEQLVGPPGPTLDHVCHVPACVNPEHLRPVTSKQNCENLAGAYRNSRSGIRGVRQRRGKWYARVRHLGVLHEGGPFASAEEAEAAAIAMRNRFFTHNDLDRSYACIVTGCNEPAVESHRCVVHVRKWWVR